MKAHCTEHDAYNAGCRWCRMARRDELQRESESEKER